MFDTWEYTEDGSEYRFNKKFKKHYGWWLIHNLVAHTLMGIFPISIFFKFHDYTARRMRGYK